MAECFQMKIKINYVETNTFDTELAAWLRTNMSNGTQNGTVLLSFMQRPVHLSFRQVETVVDG